MSRNAISPSPRFTIVAGISPAATLQKMQPDMSGPLPSERLADLPPELLGGALLRRRLRLDRGEPLQQLLLLRREVGGGPDPHAHVQVAPAALAEPGQALAPHAVHRAGLRPGLDLEQGGPVRRGDLHVAAQRRLAERDREVKHQVVAVALEPRILSDVEHRDEIARWPVARPRHALSAHREVVVVRDPGRHVDLHRLLGPDPAVAAALAARIRDHRSLAAAGGTRRDGDELPEHGARLAPHLAGAAAAAAGRGPRALLGTRAAARRATVERAHAHGLRRPRGDVGQRELERHLEVRSTVPVASTLAAAEDRVEPSQNPVVVRRPHASSSPTRRLVWSTSATILSYGMRVGPSTPITPARGPMR